MSDERKDWKPPAYQHYAKEWLVDTAHLSLEEQGAYQRCLDHQWVNGKLPDDERDRARMLGVTLIGYRRIWRRIGHYFPSGLNPRLEQVRREQQEFRDSQSASGKRGAHKRWHGEPTGEANRQPNGEPKPSPMASPMANGMANDSSAVCSLQSASALPKSKSGASAPKPVNPMTVLGPLIREHLYRGNPPDGYDTRRCAHVCKTLLATGRYSADDLRDAILTVPLVRAGKITCDDSFRRFFLKHGTVTMLVLNDRWGSGLVLDQLLHLAIKADARKPAALPGVA